MKNVLLALSLITMFGTQLPVQAADVNVLIIGSSASFSDGQGHPEEDPAVKEQAFDPSSIATELQSILQNDSAISGSKNVVFEDIHRSKQYSTSVGSGGSYWDLTYYCYSLMQYYMWPEGRADRLANLRGAYTNWNYVVLMGDPYLMANMPGVYAEGVKLLSDEISSGTAEPILLAQWPENSSSFSASNFNEVVYRVGKSGDIRVVPAGKAWDTYGSQDSSSSHPTPNGSYLAAAVIYSELFNRSAKTSGYTYINTSNTAEIADHALSTVQDNQGVAQYTGIYTNENIFQMKYLRKRSVDFCDYGSSTEDGFRNGILYAFNSCKIAYRNISGTVANPVDFSYSRGNDHFEADKQYDYLNRLDLDEWTYAFPMGDHSATGAESMRYGIDKRYYADYYYYNGTDLGVAYSAIMTNQVSLDVRAIPVRLIWAKMNHYRPELPAYDDSWHLSQQLNRGVGAFMYTLLSGRCPVGDEPADDTSTDWQYWFCAKLGYETAWRMSHVTERVPGFRVVPASATATNLTPATSETLTVNFAYAPTSDVTVAVAASDSSVGRVSPSTLTFTPSNYSNAQTVTVMAVTGSAGSHVFDITLTTSSSDFVFDGITDSWDFCNTRPEGQPPSDIIVFGNGTPIITGDTTPDASDWTDFGIVTGSATHTFTVENTSGSNTINFTGSPRASITGSSYFAVSSNISVSSLGPASSTTFEVTYTPLAGGAHTAVISVESSDATVSNYTFTVGGLSPRQPAVSLSGSTALGTTSTELSGQLTAGASANAWICWGSRDPGTGSTGDWEHVISVGTVTEAAPFKADATSLRTNATYWFRCYVENGVGSAWSAAAESFSGYPAGNDTEVFLSTDFTGRIVSGAVAQNISWASNGLAAPGDLTAVKETPEAQSTFGGLFNTAASAGHFAVDRNIGNEGPWSVDIPLVASEFEVNIESVLLDWQDFNNSGALQPNSMPKLFTISLEDSTQTLLEVTTMTSAAKSGTSNVAFGASVRLTTGNSYMLNIRAENDSNTTGNNTGFDAITVYGSTTPAPIWTLPPTSITGGSAALQGILNAEGTNYAVYVHWGPSDGGSNSVAWASTDYVGSYSDVSTNVVHHLVGLTPGQTYYYTFQVSNVVGSAWADPGWQFTTPGESGPALNLTVATVHGTAVPSGLTTPSSNSFITASIIDSPILSGATQYVCTGWSGTGSVTSGTGTATSFNITNDTTITWLWQTNIVALHSVVFNVGEHGSRTGGGALTQSVVESTSAELPEITANSGYTFNGWDSTAYTNVTSNMTINAQYSAVEDAIVDPSLITILRSFNGYGNGWGGAIKAVDGSGLTGDTHSADTAEQWGAWKSGGGDPYGPYIVVDLGAVYNLKALNIWNSSATGVTGLEVRSTTNAATADTGQLLDTTESTWSGWNQFQVGGSNTVSLNQAMNPVQTIEFDTPIASRWVSLDIDAIEADVNPTGFAELQFVYASGSGTNLLNLTINTAYGTAVPSGVTTPESNSLVNASIIDSPVINGTTQYVCTGWVGTGSAGSGSGTNTNFMIIEDSTITWQWKTNYWVEFEILGN